jgi:mannose-6-phosphate isomerase-like protein (cupin superfamily)
MADDIISVEEFERTRVARFKNLEGSKKPMLDAVIPGCEREIYQIIGRGVGEDKDQHVAITDNRDFNVAVVRCQPGKGTLHHDHETNEVFMPLKGRWKVFWGTDEDSRYVILDPWDIASCPPHVMRGFRNVGDEEGLLFVIVGGTDPGNVEWRSDVVDAAEQRGLRRGADGTIVEVGAAAE